MPQCGRSGEKPLLVQQVRWIRNQWDLRATPGAGCAEVQARAEAKIADIEERITQLDAMKRALGELVAQCRGEGPLSDCPILDALDEEAP